MTMNLLHVLMNLGPLGVMFGLMVEVIPSEIVLAFAGYLIASGHMDFSMALIFGTIGGVVAQIFLYWIGRYGGRPFLIKYGKYLFIKEEQIDLAEKWFVKYGVGVIFFARFIPVARHAISIPAGISKMKLWLFTAYTTLAVIPWSILFIYLGMKLGKNWEAIKQTSSPYTLYFLVFAVIAIAVYFFAKSKTKKMPS